MSDENEEKAAVLGEGVERFRRMKHLEGDFQIDGRPRVGSARMGDDPLLEALVREHGVLKRWDIFDARVMRLARGVVPEDN